MKATIYSAGDVTKNVFQHQNFNFKLSKILYYNELHKRQRNIAKYSFLPIDYAIVKLFTTAYFMTLFILDYKIEINAYHNRKLILAEVESSIRFFLLGKDSTYDA